MKTTLFTLAVLSFVVLFPAPAVAYEINNHADMSQDAAFLSVLRTDAQKLSRLGLKQRVLTDGAQRLPLDKYLGPIPYCFGSDRPADWAVTIPLGNTNFPSQQQGNGLPQPPWTANTTSDYAEDRAQLTIAEMIRYGACFEDADDNAGAWRPLAHFYNPQNEGTGGTGGPSSLDWMLKRGSGTLGTGQNHYTWQDAREYFYKALTDNNSNEVDRVRDQERKRYWGLTFQSLGHIMHHLQDMGSPQHVRNDAHCNNTTICRALGQYRPSGYEIYWERRFDLIRGLASTATTPILFGLPREFWNVRTDNNLVTTNPTRPMNVNEGIAAYTSTHFTSAGKDFRHEERDPGLGNPNPKFLPAEGLAFPRPSGQINDVNVVDLFPPENLAAVRDTLCGGTTINCVMGFMGTQQEPTARTSALSYFSKEMFVPRDQIGLPAYTGGGAFSQNFYTYTDAATKLIPVATQYSAGLINYFFRGEIEIKPSEQGVYGMIDLGDPSSNCKDACGFKKIKLKMKNATPPVQSVRGSIAQDMSNGQVVAVAKFSRNSCYTSDMMGEPGQANPFDASKESSCLFGGGSEPLEEIVLSDPIAGFSLASGQERALEFSFSTPIPVNAWNIRLQIVFKGKLGEEFDAI
jgi:hypothetical protein